MGCIIIGTCEMMLFPVKLIKIFTFVLLNHDFRDHYGYHADHI